MDCEMNSEVIRWKYTHKFIIKYLSIKYDLCQEKERVTIEVEVYHVRGQTITFPNTFKSNWDAPPPLLFHLIGWLHLTLEEQHIVQSVATQFPNAMWIPSQQTLATVNLSTWTPPIVSCSQQQHSPSCNPCYFLLLCGRLLPCGLTSFHRDLFLLSLIPQSYLHVLSRAWKKIDSLRNFFCMIFFNWLNWFQLFFWVVFKLHVYCFLIKCIQ